MAKKYVLQITAAERAELEAVTKRGRVSVRKVQKARAMLLADQSEHGPAWIDADIAEAVGTSVRSLESWSGFRNGTRGPVKTARSSHSRLARVSGSRSASLTAGKKRNWSGLLVRRRRQVATGGAFVCSLLISSNSKWSTRSPVRQSVKGFKKRD